MGRAPDVVVRRMRSSAGNDAHRRPTAGAAAAAAYLITPLSIRVLTDVDQLGTRTTPVLLRVATLAR
ncbi:unnamed protein product [Merluccius merluccius]